MRFRNTLACLATLALMGTAQAAPVSPQDPAYKMVAAADLALFDAAFSCDLETMAKYVSDELEFYHDNTGLARGKDDLLQKTKANICGKMRRELVPGSMQIYPLPGFGALQTGSHRFLHPAEPGNVGKGQFAHVWQFKDGSWKLYRALSFDH